MCRLADDLTLERLADLAAFSPFRFHRVLRPYPLLVRTAIGDERRKARGRRHDQLPRESGKAEHKAGPRARDAVEAADGADDDACALRRRLDLDIGGAVAQIGNEVHAL